MPGHNGAAAKAIQRSAVQFRELNDRAKAYMDDDVRIVSGTKHCKTRSTSGGTRSHKSNVPSGSLVATPTHPGQPQPPHRPSPHLFFIVFCTQASLGEITAYAAECVEASLHPGVLAAGQQGASRKSAYTRLAYRNNVRQAEVTLPRLQSPLVEVFDNG